MVKLVIFIELIFSIHRPNIFPYSNLSVYVYKYLAFIIGVYTVTNSILLFGSWRAKNCTTLCLPSTNILNFSWHWYNNMCLYYINSILHINLHYSFDSESVFLFKYILYFAHHSLFLHTNFYLPFISLFLFLLLNYSSAFFLIFRFKLVSQESSFLCTHWD